MRLILMPSTVGMYAYGVALDEPRWLYRYRCRLFLQKMKVEITKFKIDVTGERNPTPPQYYRTIEMVIHISGHNVTVKNEPGNLLAREKYCSVYHSLRKDIDVQISYVIE
jgi:uncharacterized OsmC-like protein